MNYTAFFSLPFWSLQSSYGVTHYLDITLVKSCLRVIFRWFSRRVSKCWGQRGRICWNPLAAPWNHCQIQLQDIQGWWQPRLSEHRDQDQGLLWQVLGIPLSDVHQGLQEWKCDHFWGGGWSIWIRLPLRAIQRRKCLRWNMELGTMCGMTLKKNLFWITNIPFNCNPRCLLQFPRKSFMFILSFSSIPE